MVNTGRLSLVKPLCQYLFWYTCMSSKHYINNATFLQELLEYKERKSKNPKEPIPNYIGECWMKIAEGLSHKPNFISYSYRDEMISDGIENCLMYFENFDPTKSSNPFAYFTQIIYFAFLRRIQKEKKQTYIKYKSTAQMGILDEYEMQDLDSGGTKQFELYENIADFIEGYELGQSKKKADKKNAKKPKGIEAFLEPEGELALTLAEKAFLNPKEEIA